MLKKLRKSSSRVTLVLIGVAALAGCARPEARRLRLEGGLPRRLEQHARRTARRPRDRRHTGRGFFYGPVYRGSPGSGFFGPVRLQALHGLDALGLVELELLVVAAAVSAPRAAPPRRAASAMKREERVPRPDWPQKVEELGFHFHTMDGVYWDERACYRFTSARGRQARRSPPPSCRRAASKPRAA